VSTSDLPAYDEPRIKAIFSELEGMEVMLDPDPLVFGPKRMNGKIAEARTMLSRCERIFLQVSQDLSFYKKKYRGTHLDFELQKKDLFANDPDVRAGRNVADREALATMKLRTEREGLILMEVGIQDLEMILTVVKAKRADLRDIQGRLKDQMRLCEQEMSLGQKWGSRLPPGVEAPDLDNAPKTDKNALQQVQELLLDGDEGGEVHLTAGDENWMDEKTTPEGGDSTPNTEEPASEAEEPDAEKTTPEGGDSDVEDADVDAILAEVAAAEADNTPVEGGGEAAAEDLGDLELEPEVAAEVEAKVEQAEKDIAEHNDPVGKAAAEAKRKPDTKVKAETKAAAAAEMADGHADPDAEEIDVDDLFSSDGDGGSAEAMPSVTTDEDVDNLFRQLEVDPAPKPKSKTSKDELPPSDLEGDDMDSLIDLFAAAP
jgi:hypothetical protein